MQADKFIDLLELHGVDFFTGVPDSQLKAFCDCLTLREGISAKHVIAHNEGGSVALGAGHYLSGGKVPCIYMQNSGIGNAVNPVCSLIHEKVYGIPMLFVVGWRGEPGVPDEPQHLFQGQITLELLRLLGIETFIVDDKTREEEIEDVLHSFEKLFSQGRSAAFVIKKGALTGDKALYHGRGILLREEAIEIITDSCGKDTLIISTTGKASRELYEIRERKKQGHNTDFLTVGSMGHCSLIALEVAVETPKRRVCCIDGDGAALMHMGAMAVIGNKKPENFIHIIIDNGAHETVGGMPTVSGSVDFGKIASACGYSATFGADSAQALREVLERAGRESGPVLIDVKTAVGARADLGRPKGSAKDNGRAFRAEAKRQGTL